MKRSSMEKIAKQSILLSSVQFTTLNLTLQWIANFFGILSMVQKVALVDKPTDRLYTLNMYLLTRTPVHYVHVHVLQCMYMYVHIDFFVTKTLITSLFYKIFTWELDHCNMLTDTRIKCINCNWRIYCTRHCNGILQQSTPLEALH